MEHPDDLAVPFLLLSAFRGLVDTVHEELAASGYPGVRATHGFAMQAIGPGCTSTELGDRLGVSKQAATKTAQALEIMGFVSRTSNPSDGRERILAPTARGRAMLQLSATTFARLIQDLRNQVGDRSVDATIATLQQAPRGSRGPTDLSLWA